VRYRYPVPNTDPGPVPGMHHAGSSWCGRLFFKSAGGTLFFCLTRNHCGKVEAWRVRPGHSEVKAWRSVGMLLRGSGQPKILCKRPPREQMKSGHTDGCCTQLHGVNRQPWWHAGDGLSLGRGPREWLHPAYCGSVGMGRMVRATGRGASRPTRPKTWYHELPISKQF
jgi:hypothetical protein